MVAAAAATDCCLGNKKKHEKKNIPKEGRGETDLNHYWPSNFSLSANNNNRHLRVRACGGLRTWALKSRELQREISWGSAGKKVDGKGTQQQHEFPAP